MPKHERLHAADRRKQLIEVAIDLFSRKGFGGTTTKEIAVAAGVNEAIIFRHFATKLQLYEAILDFRSTKPQREETFAELQKLMKKSDDQAVIAWIVRISLCKFREDPRFERLMLYAALEGHEIAVMHRTQVIAPFVEALVKYVEERQKDGALIPGDPKLLLSAIGGMCSHFAISRYLFSDASGTPSEKEIEETFTSILMKGLSIQKRKKK